ncbi:unnamed protein product [Cyprideis torosa]|uniref:Uncharacterized protein n=1 Tax=Cyprideis torosa TaxID=163714 RepID=A0A7R8ZNM9_9CRUS|nr:unnamed protein product [Cyprideis torosa]CAG0898371.1 unnamed protein product [Cyprideis torosa]
MTPLPSSLPQESDLSSSTSFGVLSERVLPTGVKISVVRSDIAKVEADALVNPSSGNFSLAGGIGSHLRLIGGKVFEREVTRARQSHGDIPVNGAALSKGYNFASPFVIHVYSPHFDPSSQAVSITDLRLTIRNLLDLACDNHFATIAVPSIGSGVNGFPKETAASNILNEMALYFDAKGGSSSVRQVYFVLFDQESITVYLHEIAKLVGTDPNATDASKNISSSTSATSKTTSVTSKTTSVTPKAKTKGRGKRAKIA